MRIVLSLADSGTMQTRISHQVHYIDDEVKDEEGNEICAAELVEKPGNKPISCSFLKPNKGRRDEMKYTTLGRSYPTHRRICYT
jgi:hypothetical protein